jgi:predicted amidohydrolase
MNEKTIAAIALNNRDYPCFQAKLREAAKWVELAATQGADLVVLPERLNVYEGDGGAHAPLDELALDDWQSQTQILLDTASRCEVALTVPVVVREGGRLSNRFYLLSKQGEVLGHYQKRSPTVGERKAGVEAGRGPLIEWEGLKVGGAICFDTYYQSVFEKQARADADLFLIPSLTPAGQVLNYYALLYGKPMVLAYPAWSRIIDRDGHELAEGGHRWETLRFGFGSPVVLATINFDAVTLFADFNQEKMVEVQRCYGRRVRIRFDQPNGLFFLESRSPELTVQQVMAQFGLISRQEYFARYEPERMR